MVPETTYKHAVYQLVKGPFAIKSPNLCIYSIYGFFFIFCQAVGLSWPSNSKDKNILLS